MNVSITRNIQKRKLADLVPHPRQASLAPEPSPQEIAQLAAALKRDGLDRPIEILPDGTILTDPAPVAAAKSLGWHEVDCRVRDDLAAQGEAAERRLIENALAAQSDDLGKARCHAALKRLRYGDTLPQCGRAELREELVSELGASGRSVDRLLRVVTATPVEVQNAVQRGELPLTQAERVANLKKAAQEQVAAEIRAGEAPAEVVRRHVSPARTLHKKAKHAVDAFLRALERGVTDVEGRVDRIPIPLGPQQLRTLDRTEAAIRAIRDRAAATAARSQEEAAP